MSRISPFSPLLAALLLGVGCLPAWADDDMTPRPQRIFTDKPRIEDYADYNAFLVDIMEFRRQKQEKMEREAEAARSSRAGESAVPTQQQAVAAPAPVKEDRSLYDIKGPESLEEALARASHLPHPVYTEPERFGRTTSFSFPIPQMDGDDMSANDVPGKLSDLQSVEPEVFVNPTAQESVDAQVAEHPTNDPEAREKQATKGTDDAYRASYDVATRVATDSEGNRFWTPIYVPGEVGYTVIRTFDVEVSTFTRN